MYANAQSHVCVGKEYSEEFKVKVGVHKGSVLSPLLFIIVLEALSHEFRSVVPWENLYADDLVIITESLKECVRRLLTWKKAMEEKELRVNAGKMKIMIFSMGLDLLQSSGEFPCPVCHTGVGSNSIFCKGCKHWVHKKCSGLKRLTKDPDYRCTQSQGTGRTLDGRPQREASRTWQAEGGSFLSPGRSSRSCYQFSIPVNSFKTRGCVYSFCVRSAMLRASETWPLIKPNLHRLQWNDRATIRQICNVKLQDIVTTRSNELLAQLGIEDLNLILKERRLRWYRHVECLWHTGWWKAWAWEARDDMEAADRGIAESGSSQLSILLIDLHGDLVRDLPCMQQASYLEGGPLMWMLLLYLIVNQKNDDDDDDASTDHTICFCF